MAAPRLWALCQLRLLQQMRLKNFLCRSGGASAIFNLFSIHQELLSRHLFHS